jgi:hypothetical protein
MVGSPALSRGGGGASTDNCRLKTENGDRAEPQPMAWMAIQTCNTRRKNGCFIAVVPYTRLMPIMKAVEIQGEIDDQHRLHADVPQSLGTGQVRVIVLISDEDEGGPAWAAGGVIRMAGRIERPRARHLHPERWTTDRCAPGEIHLAKFPFGDVPGMKIRPVLLLTDPLGAVPEILVAYISSHTLTASALRPRSRSVKAGIPVNEP